MLLRTILGLREPDGGTVELYGKDVQQLAAADRIALVQSYGVTFQSGALISSLDRRAEHSAAAARILCRRPSGPSTSSRS